MPIIERKGASKLEPGEKSYHGLNEHLE